MTRAKRNKAASEERDVGAVAKALGITQEDVDKAKANTFLQREATIVVPKELRLGQAIVNALSHLHKTNPTIAEDPSTALYYVTDTQLQEAIDSFHKPYGFSNR